MRCQTGCEVARVGVTRYRGSCPRTSAFSDIIASSESAGVNHDRACRLRRFHLDAVCHSSCANCLTRDGLLTSLVLVFPASRSSTCRCCLRRNLSRILLPTSSPTTPRTAVQIPLETHGANRTAFEALLDCDNCRHVVALRQRCARHRA